MANLIIRPATGAGNKVVVQDQAGAAVLTTADSGATLGNSTQDNITRLGTVTAGTLGSGVTGGSGLTALGTVASGNLSNSAIVYPAGHVIKMYSKTYTASHVFGVSGTWVTVGIAQANNLEISMDTPFSSSSKYFIQCSVSLSDHVSANFAFRLLNLAGNPIIQADTAGSRIRSFMGLGHQSTGNGSLYHIRYVSGSYLWSPGVSTAERVTLQGSNTSDSTTLFYVNRSSQDNDADWQSRSTSTMTVMEIAG